MCPVKRSKRNVSEEKVKLKCLWEKGQIEMYPGKRSNRNVPGKQVKLKCARQKGQTEIKGAR